MDYGMEYTHIDITYPVQCTYSYCAITATSTFNWLCFDMNGKTLIANIKNHRVLNRLRKEKT